MSLLTFTRKRPETTGSVIEAIGSINRQLERQFPDCTCSVVAAANSGTPSESVTVELEITHESLASLDWYTGHAEAHGLALAGMKPGQQAFEPDVISDLLLRRAAHR